MKTWNGIGRVEGSIPTFKVRKQLNLSLSTECDIIYLTTGSLKPGKRYRITVEELEDIESVMGRK